MKKGGSVSFEISLVDSATPRVDALRIVFSEDKVNAVVGRAVMNEVKRHLFEFGKANPNKLGGKRTHFYGDAAKSTHVENVSGGSNVTVSHTGIRQRIKGGKITAGRTSKWLTIPIHPEEGVRIRTLVPVEDEGRAVQGESPSFTGQRFREKGHRPLSSHQVRDAKRQPKGCSNVFHHHQGGP